MFVKRDNQGQITAISKQAEDGFTEAIDEHSDELTEFSRLLHAPVPAKAREQLQHSDTDLVRVLEDVIDLLTVKGVIQFTDLPEAAQNKLLNRKKIRLDARNLNLLEDNDTDDFILP